MKHEVAERVLKLTETMSDVDTALFTVIQSLAAEVITLRGRIESLEELVPEPAAEDL